LVRTCFLAGFFAFGFGGGTVSTARRFETSQSNSNSAVFVLVNESCLDIAISSHRPDSQWAFRENLILADELNPVNPGDRERG
jgi:hypothetical protein